MEESPGRNEPCWCGSGQKYKRCHASADAQQRRPGRGLGTLTRRLRNPLRLNDAERDAMRVAGRINAELLDVLRPHVRAGTSTLQLDAIACEHTRQQGHTPACLGYKGYPRAICTSINEVVCHGIPSERVLVEGDVVNVDVTTIVDGWHGDQSETFCIGEVSGAARKLVQVAFDCLYLAIDALTPGCSANLIGVVIARHAEPLGFSVVRQYQGHGIGRRFHQAPNILHYPAAEQESVILEPGMCFTVEPMINAGGWETVLDRADGWTVRTLDGALSAQFEHTILMTETGPEILTLTRDGPQRGHRF